MGLSDTGCKARVWGNGDMENCGKPTSHSSGICDSCRVFQTPYLKKKIAKKKKELEELEAELRRIE